MSSKPRIDPPPTDLPRPHARTLSVRVTHELAGHMVEHCRARGIAMNEAVSEALRAYLCGATIREPKVAAG